MLTKSEILMSFNSKQKLLSQLAAIEFYSKETKKRGTARKWKKRVWVWFLRLLQGRTQGGWGDWN